MPHFPARVFYSLRDIKKLWSVHDSDLRQWLINGDLKSYVWLPMMSVYEICEETHGAKITLTKELKHWEGYSLLYPHHCRSIFKSGKVYLRDFMREDHTYKLSLPDTADSIKVTVDDLVILRSEKERFEKQHKSSEQNICQVKIIGRIGKNRKIDKTVFDPTFKNISYNGKKYNFGSMQASIIRQLYDAARNGEPWQNGKQLLAKAGSQSFTISNIFKRNPLWRQIIISDERGSYRLDENFLKSISDHQSITT
jgi:hypothetical protein